MQSRASRVEVFFCDCPTCDAWLAAIFSRRERRKAAGAVARCLWVADLGGGAIRLIYQNRAVSRETLRGELTINCE